MSDRIRIREVVTLSDDWYVLRKTTFDYKKRNGSWETTSRETYDRGNGATILLYNKEKRTVVLTRQFRYPTFVNGNADGLLIETCAGLLDKDDAETCIRKETEEETGYRIEQVRKIFELYMSPGSVTEKIHFFIGEYSAKDLAGEGGGVESEDIEVLELRLDEALTMIESGAIRDGKTIILLQYAQLTGLLDR
jgi:nudix-type nucleoside diphosphatase (YffH/AdpP family)